jgi:hypothetical protein
LVTLPLLCLSVLLYVAVVAFVDGFWPSVRITRW